MEMGTGHTGMTNTLHWRLVLAQELIFCGKGPMCCTGRSVWGVIPAQALQNGCASLDLISTFCLQLQGKTQVMHEATAERTSVSFLLKGVCGRLKLPQGDQARSLCSADVLKGSSTDTVCLHLPV